MKKRSEFQMLSLEERAEVDALIHEAYANPDGTARPHSDAVVEFDRLLMDAMHAHREWPHLLLDEWRHAGMKAFIADRYKHSELFEFTHRKKAVQRTAHRGTRRVDDEGRASWVQEQFVTFTRAQLIAAIADEQRAIADRQTNIAMYRALVDLLDETDAYTVAEALEQRGQTISEFLDERLAS